MAAVHFYPYGRRLAAQLNRMLSQDSAAEKLKEVKKALPLLATRDDIEAAARILFELGALQKRAEKARALLAKAIEKRMEEVAP